MQGQEGPVYVPPRITLDWSPIETLLRGDAPAYFRNLVEEYAWEIVVQAWEAYPTAVEKVDAEWRKLSRRNPFVKAFAPMFRRRVRGRPFSLTWFDSLILAFDFHFRNLECKGNSWTNPKSWSGQFPEIIFEIVRQVSPYLWIDDIERALREAGIEKRPALDRGRIRLPSGINIRTLDDEGAKRSAVNAIGRRIHELRKGERRDAEGMRQLGAGETFWKRH